MANLTISVDDVTLKRAKKRALEEDTSVNAVLREYLEEYAGRRQEQVEWLIIENPLLVDAL